MGEGGRRRRRSKLREAARKVATVAAYACGSLSRRKALVDPLTVDTSCSLSATGIFELKNLNKLLLLSNNISGNIASEIGNYSSLIRFQASNQITGNIPPRIGNLRNLDFLDLASNRISGFIPEEIYGSRNLTFLDLHSNLIAWILISGGASRDNMVWIKFQSQNQQ